jgi:hypothetical protein
MTEHKVVFNYQDQDSKIIYESFGITTDEVMNHFVCFLLSMGYARESIHSAMQTIVDEHEDYLQNKPDYKLELAMEVA